ncbi:MAG TPA: hypothetical protein VKB93_29035 [Thermoanaerobaculia bacterium]|nr:hypothetical protein [Thermoanaerobaculia bacterium]
MTKRLLCAVLLTALALPMYADFNSIARAIDRQQGVKRVWVPGLGLARFLVWVVRPKGVHDFQLVTFEGGDDADPRQLQAIMRDNVGPGFTPLVRVWSKKSREWSFIYARTRPNSERVELIVLAHDDEDTVLVRVDVDATIIGRELHTPRSVTRYAQQ